MTIATSVVKKSDKKIEETSFSKGGTRSSSSRIRGTAPILSNHSFISRSSSAINSSFQKTASRLEYHSRD